MGGPGSGRPPSPQTIVKRMSQQNRGPAISNNMTAPNYGGLRRGARKTSDDPFITTSEGDDRYILAASGVLGDMLYHNGSEWVKFARPSSAGSYNLINTNAGALTWTLVSTPATPDWSSVLFAGSTTSGQNPTISTDDQLFFRDSAIYIQSSTDGQLDIIADTTINLGCDDVLVGNKITHAGDSDTYISFTGNSIDIVAGSSTYFNFSTPTFTPEIGLNPLGINMDTRIQSENDTSCFFVDGSADKVGVGTAGPASKLDVAGSFQCDSVTNDTGLASGTYTPTITGVTNVDSTTAYECQYIRVGNVVHVTGKAGINTTAGGGTATTWTISLPVSSNFTAVTQCSGIANENTGNRSATISGNTTSDVAQVDHLSGHTNERDYYFNFTYQVL